MTKNSRLNTKNSTLNQMSSTTIFLIALLSFLVACAIMVFIGFRLIKNIIPRAGKLEEDLKEMEKEIKPWVDQLIPWAKDSAEIMSTTQLNKSVKKSFGLLTVKGIITSIYQEPMVAYSYRKYNSKEMNAALFAQTANHKFVFHIGASRTQVRIDGKVVGTLDRNNNLVSTNNKRLAKISDENTLVLPIIVGDKEVGNLIRPEQSEGPNTRAFGMLSSMNESEEAVLLSLGILEIIKNELPND